MIEQSLLNMENNLFRHYGHFYLSTHEFDLAVGQFVIDGKSQYLTKWLNKHDLSLIQVSQIGLKGKTWSLVKLTKLVTMTDTVYLNELNMLEVRELDALLDNKSLSDIDFFNRIFPNLLTLTRVQVKEQYDFCAIDTKSVKHFIFWLTHKAEKINVAERQKMVRQAEIILRIAESGDGSLPMKKKPSYFGRNYYEGISVQSVHRSLRKAMLGNCYQYDLRISVISWKMGFAALWCDNLKEQRQLHVEFAASLAYLKDKKNFREYIRQHTFGLNNKISDSLQMDLVKRALTALSFGARINQHGWVDSSGRSFNPAIVDIFKNIDDRKRFISCGLVQQFRSEQKKLDDFIFELFTTKDRSLVTDTELQTESGRVSKAKVMAFLYQHAETIVMDLAREQLRKSGREVIASVHDAIFVKHKLSAYDRENIEYQMREKSGIKYWVLEQEKHQAYKGDSPSALQDELAHKKRIAEEGKLAQRYMMTLSKQS